MTEDPRSVDPWRIRMLMAQSNSNARPVGLIVTAIALMLSLSSLSQTIVADPGGIDQLTLVIIAYLVCSTVATPLYGKFGDVYGRKRVLQVAIAIFLAGSVLCAVSPPIPLALVSRVAQGLGVVGLMVVVMIVVAGITAPRQRVQIMDV